MEGSESRFLAFSSLGTLCGRRLKVHNRLSAAPCSVREPPFASSMVGDFQKTQTARAVGVGGHQLEVQPSDIRRFGQHGVLMKAACPAR